MLKNVNRIEMLAAVAAVGLVAAGCLAVLFPFLSAILWAAVLAYTTWPLLLRLERLLGGRRSLAAFLMTALIALVLILPFAVAGVTLAENVARFEELLRLLQGGLPADAPEWVRRLPWIGPDVERAWPGFARDTGIISRTLHASGSAAGKWLLQHSLAFGKGVLQLALSVLIAYFFYRDGDRLMGRIADAAQRIAGDVSQRLLAIAGKTVRGVVYGIIGTALVQAAVAALGFWVAGVPSPFLLGLLTFLLAMVPAGPPLVWLPAALWLFHQGHTGWAVFMAAWGLLVISGIDNFVRPYLISRTSNLPFIIVLLGVVGGVMAFGLIGLFLGPVLLAVGFALVREFGAPSPPLPPKV
ncbi:MAG: AI-2E family transporter [bacterium]